MALNTKGYRAKFTFTEPLLGSQTDNQIKTRHEAHRAGFELPEDEIETLADAVVRGVTVFHKDTDGTPLLFDYQVKGAIKNAGKVCNNKHGLPRNLRQKIVDLVYVYPRRIRLHPPDGDENFEDPLPLFERPLQAQTARGPRVALASSEILPRGTWFECQLEVLEGDIKEEVLQTLLDYLFYTGIGQYRTGGYGRCQVEMVAEAND